MHRASPRIILDRNPSLQAANAVTPRPTRLFCHESRCKLTCMNDREAVLFANEAFYSAFARADLQAMDALWAREGPVTCIHPGWGALTTRQAVIDSWRDIFRSGDTSSIGFYGAHPHLLGDIALIICYEKLPSAVLIASNAFRRGGRGWRMVHHQAGRVDAPPPEAPAPGAAQRPN